jgi:para-nitrobenzyl esterase
LSGVLGLALAGALALPAGAVAAVAGPTGDNASAPAGDSAIVNTKSGPVRGVVDKAYRRWQGVPFAAPPVGDLRWKAPQPVKPWQAPLDATQPRAQCEQGGLMLGGHAAPAQPTTSEDCLYLNVTVPADASPKHPLPVMFWTHGGAYVIGSGSEYDARRLATTGHVVVVTINYRLGVFGFLGLKGLADSGDFGLEDQQAALRWTRENIAAFGGDAHNVTMFGESAGGFSTCAQLTSPAADKLIDKAIAHSGSCSTENYTDPVTPGSGSATDVFQPLDQVQRSGTEVASSQHCDDAATAVDCLRKVSADTLLNATSSRYWAPAYNTPTLPEKPLTALKKHHFHHVPIILGTNQDEGRLFVGLSYDFNGQPITADQYGDLMRKAFGARADKISAAYPLKDYATPSLAWSRVATDRSWTCPTLFGGDELLGPLVPTYSYEFNDADAPSMFPFPKDFPPGATHAAELQYLFDMGGQPSQFNADQQKLANQMIGYWTRFARTGDPNGKGAPTWERFTKPTQTQSLAPKKGGIHQVNLGTEHKCELWKNSPASAVGSVR